MDPVEQLYHLQLESRQHAQRLQRETIAGFEYLRKSAQSSAQRMQQSLGEADPPSARSADRGWGASTRRIGGAAAPQERESPHEAVPEGLPTKLRNILIRNQQMELRWQREFAERLREAGTQLPSRDPFRAADLWHEAEQRASAAPAAPPRQGARAKGRGWGDSTRRIGEDDR